MATDATQEADHLSQGTVILRRISDRLPSGAMDYFERHSLASFYLRAIALFVVFLLVERFIKRTTTLAAADYESPYLFLAVLDRLGIVPMLVLAVAGVLLIRYGALLSSWKALELGNRFRWFIVFLAFIMAWPFATHGYNHFFDQGHYLDRVLIALLVPLIWFRPVFIYPFLLFVFATMWQLGEPAFSGSVFPHKLQVLHILNLFGAAFLIHAITGSRRMDVFLFFACCIVAAAYWEAALAKLQTDWVTYGHIYRLPVSAYAHGWLAFLNPESVIAFAKTISVFDWPMRIATLVIETACLFFLWRRALSIGLLAAVIAFHIGVFVLLGFLFWTWILLDVALLVLLWSDRREKRIGIYSPGRLLLSVLLIGFASLWVNPAHLGWFDTRLTYTYRLEGVGVSGEKYLLPPEFFSPYEDSFTMGGFSYLVEDHGVLTGPYGTTHDREVADAMIEPVSPDEVFALESKLASDRYNPARAGIFYDFVTRYVSTWNERHADGAPYYALHPPRQFWSYNRGEIPPPEETIREVIITEVTTLYDEQDLKVIREYEIERLDIPSKRQGCE